MEKIKSLLKQPNVLGRLGLLTGLIFGLFILGWWLWPVKWVDGSPSYLRADYKQNYLCMTIDSFIRNNDQTLMKMRWASLGDSAPDLLKNLTKEECRFSSNAEIDSFKGLMNVGNSSANIPSGVVSQTAVPPASNNGVWFLPVMLFCLLTLAAGGVLAYLLLSRRGKIPSIGEKIANRKEAPTKPQEEHFTSPTQSVTDDSLKEKPMAQFMTSYKIGEDLYDESFSIDSSNGEFLGECGVGIAETIGVGDPKKVTALEMWLFDKNDIQTITKVLLSEHAFNDESTRQRLLSKGEPILAKPSQRFIMETASLQLEARVVDLVYGRGPLPDNSFFSRVTLEISVWMKVH